MPLTILMLVGSPSSAGYRELSELYARGCLEALADPAWRFQIAHISPDGLWRFPNSLRADAIAAAPAHALPDALARFAAARVDLALPQMFCARGMTTLRALLELLDIPYLGNPPPQMALAADKAKARAIVAAAGVAVPAGEVLRRGEMPTLACPCVVKPNDADNSEGVTFVSSAREMPAALDAAFAHCDLAVVETFIELGREVRCGVVERGGELICLPLEEYFVDPAIRPIRRDIDKLRRAAGGALFLGAKTSSESWILPTDDPITAPVWRAARRCHLALGCRQYSLFDFRVDPAGQPWFLEAGLYCSFSPASVIVTMAEAAGMPLRRFFAEAVEDLLAAPSIRRL